jgi:hypothetical protein
MKRSELKEAIKAEITSVLSEEMTDKEREDKLQQAKRGGGKEKPLRKLAAIGKKEDSLKEEAGFTEVSKNEIKFHLDQFYGGNIDGNALANAIEEIVFDRVSFSDVREDEEPTAADLKKKDSVATISNKLQKVTSEIKKHLAMYKDAEGDEAKKLAINMLKKLNAEKKKLEKSL